MPPIAPPFPNENAFYSRFFFDLGAYLDEDNRRLHEVDFRSESNAETYALCPFKDSRHGYLINRAALKQITARWDAVLSGLRFFAALGGDRGEEESALARAWRVTLSTMFAPMYLLIRANNPYANGQLPVAVAGLFKIMLDVPTTIDLMLLAPDQEKKTECDFRTIREFADHNGILLNGEFACAGSAGLIDEVLSILFDHVSPEWISNKEFATYFPNHEELIRFTYHMSCQYVVSFVYQLATALAMESAFSDLANSGLYTPMSPHDEHRLSAYERRRRIALASMMHSANVGPLLERLARLVEKEATWRMPTNHRINLQQFLADTLSFCDLTVRSKASRILGAHGEYESKFLSCVRGLQQTIEVALGTSGVFTLQPVVGPSTRLPAALLSEIVKEADGRRASGKKTA